MSNSVSIQKYRVEVLEIKQHAEEILLAYARSEGIVFGEHSENTKEREEQFKSQLVKNLLIHLNRLEKIDF